MAALAAAAGAERGWQLANLDCVVHAQRPKLSPHKLEIRRRMAEILGVHIDQIGLKAKTGEDVGPVGRQEAIEAQCVVLLKPCHAPEN